MKLSTQQIGKCKIVITEIENKKINSINISVTTPPSLDIHEVGIENPILIKAIKYYIESGEFEYFLEILKECHSETANTIASMLSKEFNSVLKTIAETVYKKTKELIPVAANKPNLKNWPSHRKLLMFLSRSRKLGLEDKERINNLKLFILENNEVPNFLAMRVKGTYFGIDNPSMLQILDIVTHLPDIDDKAFHKLKTNNPVILLSFDEKEIISKEYLSKLADEYSYFSPPIIIKQGNDYKIYGCNNGNWKLHDLILEKNHHDNQNLYQDLEKIQFPQKSSSPIFIDPEEKNTTNKNVFPNSVYEEVKTNQYHSIGRPFLKSERVENTAKNSILSSIGNCRENSAIVEVLLGGYENNLNNEAEKYPDIGINKVIIERAAITPRGENEGDHAYVLMNREQYRILELTPELKKDIQEEQILIGSHHLYIEPNDKGLYYFAKNMTEPKFIKKERLSLYELEYFSDKKLNPGVIEINSISEGLQYRMLDREGLEKNDIIPWGALDITKQPNIRDIMQDPYCYLSKIQGIISKTVKIQEVNTNNFNSLTNIQEQIEYIAYQEGDINRYSIYKPETWGNAIQPDTWMDNILYWDDNNAKPSKNYIIHHKEDTNLLNKSYIGAGHTKRHYQHAEIKSRPENFFNYKPQFSKNLSEQSKDLYFPLQPDKEFEELLNEFHKYKIYKSTSNLHELHEKINTYIDNAKIDLRLKDRIYTLIFNLSDDELNLLINLFDWKNPEQFKKIFSEEEWEVDSLVGYMQNNSKLQEGLFNLLSNEFFFKKSMCIVKSHNEISSGGKIDFGFKHLNELNQINMLQKHEKLLKEMIEKDSNVLFDLFIQFNKNSLNLMKTLGTEFIVNTLTKNLNEDSLLDKFPILLSEIKMENKYTKQNLPIPLFFTDFFSDVRKIILTELLKKDKTTVFTFIDNLYHLLLNTMRYNDSSKLLYELIEVFNLPIEMVISYMNENPKVALAIVQDSDVLQRYLSNDSVDKQTKLNLCKLTFDNNIRIPLDIFLQYYKLSKDNNVPLDLSSLKKELISYNSEYYDILLSLSNVQFMEIIPFIFNIPQFDINPKQVLKTLQALDEKSSVEYIQCLLEFLIKNNNEENNKKFSSILNIVFDYMMEKRTEINVYQCVGGNNSHLLDKDNFIFQQLYEWSKKSECFTLFKFIGYENEQIPCVAIVYALNSDDQIMLKTIKRSMYDMSTYLRAALMTGNGKIIAQSFEKWKKRDCKYDSENELIDKVNNKFGPFSNDDLLKLYYNNPEQINKFKKVGLAKPPLDTPSERLSQINSKIINYLLLMDKNIDTLSEQFTEEEKESFSSKINMIKNIPNEIMHDHLFNGLTMFVFELKNQSNPKSVSNDLYTKLIQYLKKEYIQEICNCILTDQNWIQEEQLPLITTIINEVLTKEKYSPRFQFASLDSGTNKLSDIFEEYDNILKKPIEQPKIPF